MGFTIGEWYRPDTSWKDEPSTLAEAVEEEEYDAALDRGEDPEYLPWQVRRAAVAGENLLRDILREFGPPAPPPRQEQDAADR